MIKIGRNIDAYLAEAQESKARKGCGVLYLPDVRGIWQNSKLMADGFAASGYTMRGKRSGNGENTDCTPQFVIFGRKKNT